LVFLPKGHFRGEVITKDLSTEAVTNTEEVSQAAAYVASTIAAVPVNLPTGDAPTFADDIVYEADETPNNIETEFTDLENRAHAANVLLSSDAMRYFVAQFPLEEQFTALDEIIAKAHNEYPTEDGWVVVNLERMQTLIDEEETPSAAAAVEGETPEGVGSLAEAIVTGNIGAAYTLIGHRPMVALSDAVADLDAVYRNRQGQETMVSDLLETVTENISALQLQEVIVALTTALDGVYTDEDEAVKMALLKAVHVLRK